MTLNEDVNKQLKDELVKNVAHYRNVMHYMGLDVPIQVLCLPKRVENILLRGGYLRLYDIIEAPRIKGIGKDTLAEVRSRIHELFTVPI